MDVGGKLLLSLIETSDLKQYHEFHLSASLFFGEEVALFKFVHDHVEKYQKLPSAETVTDQFVVPPASEPAQFYFDKVVDRFTHVTLKVALQESHELLSSQKGASAKKILAQAVEMITATEMRQNLTDFAEDVETVVSDLYWKANGLGSDDLIYFGWPYLDEMVGGLGAGDVVSYLGRPGMGKTYKLLKQAHDIWWKQKKSVLLVSMEMTAQALMQRLAAMHTHMGVDYVKKGNFPSFPTNMGDQFFDKLATVQNAEGKLWIVDAMMTANPSDVLAMASHLKPDCLMVDAAYLLDNDNQRLQDNQKMADNLRRIKRGSTRLGIPAILSYQFNNPKNKPKSQQGDFSQDDAFGSDWIAQISSIILGLFEQESVETMRRRKIKVLKGREGAMGEFNIHWDFHRMNFDEMPKKTSALEAAEEQIQEEYV